MKKLLRVAAGAAAGFGLMTGVALADSGSIGTTGPDSTNRIEFRNSAKHKVDNKNKVSASNSNNQNAYTGNAKVKHNTTGGDATSGMASNDNSLSASLSVRNSNGCGCVGMNMGDNDATIDNTGPDSRNVITFRNSSEVDVKNNNELSVHNTNYQTASSGNAEVSGNTTGGSATSGDASNTNSTEIMFEVVNE